MEGRGSGIIRGFIALLASSNLRLYNRFPDRDLKPGPPEYEAGESAARPQHSVRSVAFVAYRVSVLRIYRIRTSGEFMRSGIVIDVTQF
jgi:hypothetical protein